MRCIACDAEITETQARARDGVGGFTELCSNCHGIVTEINKTDCLPEGHSGGELWQPHTYGLDHTGKGTYTHPNSGRTEEEAAMAARIGRCIHG